MDSKGRPWNTERSCGRAVAHRVQQVILHPCDRVWGVGSCVRNSDKGNKSGRWPSASGSVGCLWPATKKVSGDGPPCILVCSWYPRICRLRNLSRRLRIDPLVSRATSCHIPGTIHAITVRLVQAEQVSSKVPELSPEFSLQALKVLKYPCANYVKIDPTGGHSRSVERAELSGEGPEGNEGTGVRPGGGQRKP